MQTIKTKVQEINIGKYDVDSIVVNVDNQIIEICFNKNENIAGYLGKEIVLIEKQGLYSIEKKNESFNKNKK